MHLVLLTAVLTAIAPAPAMPSAPAYLSPDTTSNPTIDALVTRALSELSDDVARTSHRDALRFAFQAYFNYTTANPDDVRNPYLYFVDYGLDNSTPRGYVFDMRTLEVVDGPFTVAHGRGSSKSRNGMPTRFTNVEGSASTSLGLYLAQETYGFSGKSNGVRYTSIGLRMKGLSGRFNSRARQRGVVVHGAPYVSAGDAGRSEGCPAMEQFRARTLIPKIADGGMIFLFSPLDRDWLENDPWVNG